MVEEILLKLDRQRFTRRTVTNREGLLKELARISHRGYAVGDEEREEAVRCVGVAILNPRGEAIAAISVSGPSSRVTMHRIPQIPGRLIGCAKAISTRSQYSPVDKSQRGSLQGHSLDLRRGFAAAGLADD
jgi:DNA-binding IclR family transcriptional regulator